jgi:uncharacterized protein YndB with AHSA1/START domain
MSSSELTLELQRVLPASRETVWTAMTEPALLARWWGPAGFTCPSIEMDLRVGGAYRIAMQPPDGELFHLRGEFLVVEPPSRLSYTFVWEEPDPDDRETVATLTLRDLEGSTELSLVQRPFLTEARRALHDGGWTDGMERLHDVLGENG